MQVAQNGQHPQCGIGGAAMSTKDTEIKSRSDFNSVVTIRGGVVKNITRGYIYIPKTHFNGGTIKWFDDSKLVKGGAV